MTEDLSGSRRMGQVGDEEGHLSYGGYLRIQELIDLQTLRSQPAAHDELLFIVVHQAFELWFREMIFELESIRDLMFAQDPHRARHLLQRVHTIERLLIEQIEVLETMSPQDFLEFRTNLAPASGFQSTQFREIEFLCGLKQRNFVGMAPAEERQRLERRLDEPTLWDGFRDLLERSGLPMPEDDADVRLT
ncbi:MAG: tryptophan 2,3-dioxygenase family protein, partial [Actinomycetota bacterium]